MTLAIRRKQVSEVLPPVELAMMQVLWAQGPSTVQEVQERMEGEQAYTTVQTILNIMVQKGRVAAGAGAGTREGFCVQRSAGAGDGDGYGGRGPGAASVRGASGGLVDEPGGAGEGERGDDCEVEAGDRGEGEEGMKKASQQVSEPASGRKAKAMPGLLLGVLDGGALERRVLRLLDSRLPWARRWRVAAGFACLTVLASAAMGMRVISVQPVSAQDSLKTPAMPKFEVVSIKPCEDPRQRQVLGDIYPSRGNSSPGRLSTGCYPLLDNNGMGLIRAAYADTFTPINGGPSWMHSAFYEINAVAEGNPSVKMMMGPMLQALLEGRFHLKIHRQVSEGPVYVLSVTRGGPKLRPFTEGRCTPYSTFPAPALPPGKEYCESLMSAGSPAAVNDQGATLDYFSRQLLSLLDRPVINKTGISGRFDIHLEFSREGTRFAAMPLMRNSDGASHASDSGEASSIFTAVQEQLGLKLEPAKGPVEVVVIDRVERPTEN